MGAVKSHKIEKQDYLPVNIDTSINNFGSTISSYGHCLNEPFISLYFENKEIYSLMEEVAPFEQSLISR